MSNRSRPPLRKHAEVVPIQFELRGCVYLGSSLGEKQICTLALPLTVSCSTARVSFRGGYGVFHSVSSLHFFRTTPHGQFTDDASQDIERAG